MVELFVTVKDCAATPPNDTAVAPMNPSPVMVTSVPATPLLGVKLEIEGTATKTKEVVAVPPVVLTRNTSDTLEFFTSMSISVFETTVYDVGATPAMSTACAVDKLVATILNFNLFVGSTVTDVMVGGEIISSIQSSLPWVTSKLA